MIAKGDAGGGLTMLNYGNDIDDNRMINTLILLPEVALETYRPIM
jgi:hypothetical protein